MLTLRAPDADVIASLLVAQQELPLTYDTPGMTRGAPPSGYNVDHLRQKLGTGPDLFERAASALRSWEMFRVGWVRLESGGRPADLGAVVAIVVRLAPLWWSNACRIVYLIDEVEPVRQVGFAYGTLPSHAERGEERFAIEMDAEGNVWYDLLAHSRPRHWLARLGYPLTRAMQQRFALASAAAMERAVARQPN